jgi:hypothetical protein
MWFELAKFRPGGRRVTSILADGVLVLGLDACARPRADQVSEYVAPSDLLG